MKTIELTKNKFAIVDDEDHGLLNTQRWHYTSRGYAGGWSKQKQNASLLMHRVITKAPPEMVVDHINGDTLDNRRTNLRVCSQKDNLNNMHKPRKLSASGHRGVYWFKPAKKWSVAIRINSKQRHVGYFGTLDEAVEARNKAKEIHND